MIVHRKELDMDEIDLTERLYEVADAAASALERGATVRLGDAVITVRDDAYELSRHGRVTAAWGLGPYGRWAATREAVFASLTDRRE